MSTAFPLSFGDGIKDLDEDNGAAEVDERSLSLTPLLGPASCHAGIDGLPGNANGDDGEGDNPDPRLKSKAFRDFNSCCSSARDCV